MMTLVVFVVVEDFVFAAESAVELAVELVVQLVVRLVVKLAVMLVDQYEFHIRRFRRMTIEDFDRPIGILDSYLNFHIGYSHSQCNQCNRLLIGQKLILLIRYSQEPQSHFVF